jgi:phosphatidylglycerophosphatase A
MNATPDAVSPSRKPRISYFLATACGLGYLKPGPGTWGSLMGVAISILVAYRSFLSAPPELGWQLHFWQMQWRPYYLDYIAVAVVAAAGVYVAGRVEHHWGKSDPQFVVIDEVSGQLLALSFPFTLLNWKSWLLGFILFRVFDIWKPFPARQAESLHGGWGIMADDWIAGIYAALVLWAVHATGILK